MTKFEVPEGLMQESMKALEISRNTGKVRRGTNEATKVIERGKAKLVYIAQDVQPPEIVAHLPGLCDDKKIPYIFVGSKLDLGKASGIDVPTASVAVMEVGNATKEISAVIEKLNGIRSSGAQEGKPKAGSKPAGAKQEKPAEKKPEKAEAKKEEPKAEGKQEKKEEAKPGQKQEKKEDAKANPGANPGNEPAKGSANEPAKKDESELEKELGK